jgi:hypothetical protein
VCNFTLQFTPHKIKKRVCNFTLGHVLWRFTLITSWLNGKQIWLKIPWPDQWKGLGIQRVKGTYMIYCTKLCDQYVQKLLGWYYGSYFCTYQLLGIVDSIVAISVRTNHWGWYRSSCFRTYQLLNSNGSTETVTIRNEYFGWYQSSYFC